MRRICLIVMALLLVAAHGHAVLKEKNLDQTLSVLRTELTEYHQELMNQSENRKEMARTIVEELKETFRRSNQNALMLYSQQPNYVFDLTYACHEATEQYREFREQHLPFQTFLKSSEVEIAKYDSLIVSLETVRPDMLGRQARADRDVCLTLATDIKNTLEEHHKQVAEYMNLYQFAEQHLKSLNDYANKRYEDIQAGIFMNGSENYWSILRHFGRHWQEMQEVLNDKYKLGNRDSDWDSRVIVQLFMMIGFYVIVAVLINMLVFKFLPRRFRSKEFLKKRPCIIMATTTITFAAILGILRATLHQNFYLMASELLIEYAWLLSVVLISLLLRVNGSQIKSAFHIYTPLLLVGFLVIAFRIVLIPNELVNIMFPPILLLCTLWQWNVIKRHNRNVPRQDMIYTYLSQGIFILSLGCAMLGYTLLAVQILIWWIMQLTCILTITCMSQYLKLYGKRHSFDKKPITKTWLFLLVYKVLLPMTGVLSVLISVYWATDVFNLSDLCWQIFNKNFVDMENLKVSIMKLFVVVSLWFVFSYISHTILSLMRLHYQTSTPSTAASREVMGRNVIQVIVWGAWILISLSFLHISVAWLLAISGGLSTGIGFASKDIIENIYYGASLMAGRIKVGDWIEVDGTMGRVTSISYTSTIVESLGGEVITFQNSQLFTKNYKNLTKNHGYVLATVPFGVAYGSNVKQVTELVEAAVNDLHHEWIDHTKPIKSAMSGMGDSSVDFKIFVWAEAPKKTYVISDVLKCIYNTLNANGIEIPFPQRDIHIKSN